MPAPAKPALIAPIADLAQDLRYGLRQMARRPALYGLALLSLALALGATTALFSVANALYLRDAPGIGEPAGLVAIHVRESNGMWGSFPYSAMSGHATPEGRSSTSPTANPENSWSASSSTPRSPSS